MARRMIFIVACLCIATAAFGQRVTRSFNDVSMSEALKWLNERSGEYNISFLYNELEDFRRSSGSTSGVGNTTSVFSTTSWRTSG